MPRNTIVANGGQHKRYLHFGSSPDVAIAAMVFGAAYIGVFVACAAMSILAGFVKRLVLLCLCAAYIVWLVLLSSSERHSRPGMCYHQV